MRMCERLVAFQELIVPYGKPAVCSVQDRAKSCDLNESHREIEK